MHLTLKSSHARGKMALTNNKLAVGRIIEEKAAKYQIKIHRKEIMRNHIHMVVSFKSRALMQSFMKTAAGFIARVVTGARKGRSFGKRFWDHLAHTRIITGKRDFARVLRYLWKNEIEREEGPESRWCIEDDERIERERKRHAETDFG